jgi:cytochrome c biogenesis protein CcmG/thiol:disulfide interchange protein DsbE
VAVSRGDPTDGGRTDDPGATGAGNVPPVPGVGPGMDDTPPAPPPPGRRDRDEAPPAGPDADPAATTADVRGAGRSRRARLQLLGLAGAAVVVVLAAFGGWVGEEGPGATDAAAAGASDDGADCPAVSSSVAFDRSSGLGAMPVASFADLTDPDTVVCTSDWEGTPTVVNFWATWCPFCVEEMPDLQSASQTLGDEVRFVGIDVQDNRDDAIAFLASTGVTYDQVHSPAGTFYTELGNRGMPTTLFVTADGTIAWRHTGPLTEQQVLALVELHLGVEA